MQKKVTREEYQKKFEEQMGRSHYELAEDEVIVQCHAPYPSYWFVSNKGKLFSAYRKELNIIDPYYRQTGKRGKNGKRPGNDWYYEYHVKGEKHNRHITMHKLIAEHFLSCDIETEEDEKLEVHHIKSRKSFDKSSASECNNTDNLQILPKSVHQKATYYGSHTPEQREKDSRKLARKSGVKDIEVDLNTDEYRRLIMDILNDALERGNQPIVYLSNGDDRVEVRKISAVGYKEE